MTQTVQTYRWTASEFLRAWEAGAFDHRVELIDGEVWPVVIGDWHSRTTGRVIRALPGHHQFMAGTLASGESLPDPDCWVLQSDAEPVGSLSQRLSAWSAADVHLVIKVSDDSVVADLDIKTRIYGGAGYAVYWVVTPDAVYEHTQPSATGYRARQEYPRGTRIPVRYADTDLAVDDLRG